MPEGPEIRRAADKVARRLVGGCLLYTSTLPTILLV